MELVNLQTGSAGKIISSEEGNASSIYLSPNGDQLAFQMNVSTVKLLRTSDWRTLATLDEQAASDTPPPRFLLSVRSVPAVAFRQNNYAVTGAIEGGGIKVWDTRTGEAKKTITRDDPGSLMAVSANGEIVAEVSNEQLVRVWDVETGQDRTIDAIESKPLAISLAGDGRVLAVAESRRIALIDLENSKLTRAIDTDENPNPLIMLSPDGKTLASALGDTIKIWAVADARLLRELSTAGAVSALAIGPRNEYAVGRRDGTLSVFDASGALILQGKKHKSPINVVVFSSDGSLLASGGDDQTAIIWDAISGKTRQTLKGHDLAISSLAFSPDATSLAVGSGNASVAIWEVPKGKLNRVLK